MVQSSIALIAAMVLIGMSLRANARFREETRLPMQWSVKGSVNWTAPRRLALAITPAFAICILAAAVVSTLTLEPRRGQEGFEVPVIVVLALAFIGAHGLHLWLIGKALKRNGS
jgi:hypothetical protein